MDNFCYVGDMLSVDGDADAAVEARISVRRRRKNIDSLSKSNPLSRRRKNYDALT